MDEENYYVELCKNPIRFEPVSKITNVFFDESNKQVFAVRSGGATGVVIKGPDERTSKNFRMEDRGEVISIKFSSNMKILAIQRSPKSVEFLNYSDGIDPVEYSQSCKGKSTRILGFNWVLPSDIVFITDNGIEYYQVIPEKRSLKALKAYSVPVNWFVWMPETCNLLLSSGTIGHVIHPFHFKNSSMVKLSKFEIDLPVIPKPPKLTLLERDVTMANIYGNVYVVVLRHQAKGGQQGGAEVALYQLQKEGPAKKSDVLRLGMSGRFAINVVDNVLLVHHQASKATMVFDIGLAGESDGYVVYHHPVLPPLPIKPFKLNLPVVPGSGVTGPTQEFNCELYSPHWIVFQPNIVIDAKIGCLWYLQLRLDPLLAMMPNKAKLVDFLLLRQESKRVVLTVCRQMLMPGHQSNLQIIARVYDRLNSVLWNYHEADAQPVTVGGWGADWRKNHKQVIIDQSDMYTHVFAIFSDNKEIHYKFMVAVLIEYIRSLNQIQIPVQHYLYELVINVLVQNNCFYQLHQFLQYHVLSDSKPLACLLLSLEGVYPPAHQLALDMLKRLSTANEEIVEVLLSKQAVLPALRFLRSVGAADTIPARKFLEAAKATQDDMLYHTVFKFFEQRNVRLRGSSQFNQGEHCDQYVEKFVDIFGQEALASES